MALNKRIQSRLFLIIFLGIAAWSLVVPNSAHLPFEMRGTGPHSGVITAFPEAGSFKAVENYFPSLKSGGGIEYVYDAERNIFAVGKVNHAKQIGITGSKHQQLARAINANEDTVLGGMFTRGKAGEIILNENSGHYGRRWPLQPETRQKLIELLSRNLDAEIDFGRWGTSASKGVK